MDDSVARELAERLYRALAEGDRDSLTALLHPDFTGRTTEGLPLDLGGTYQSAKEMRARFWGRIAKSYTARSEPEQFHRLADGRLLVTGRYVGQARDGGGKLDAAFTHLLSFVDGRIGGLEQLTDSARWASALEETSTVAFGVADGVATLRLNRPSRRNAINQAMADELRELAGRCARDERVRAVLLLGNGPAFTVGGDIDVFGETAPEELPGLLSRMTTPYHEALRLLGELDKPVLAGVHGAVAGGGLGLLYCADIAFAAAGTRFATGFCALGLTGDGGSSWYLPRLIGPRRAAEMYLRNRVLVAAEAAEWGLVSEVVPAEELEHHAMAEARRLATGPTRAYAELRRLLRGSFDAPLGAQLDAERGALCRSAATEDAARAIQSFLHKAEPTFQGR